MGSNLLMDAETYLSPPVYDMVCCMGISTDSSLDYVKDGCINIESLRDILPEENPNDDNFREYVKSLSVMFNSINLAYSKKTPSEFHQIASPMTKWMTEPQLIDECFIWTLEGEAASLHALQVMLSLLERSLGNVFLLNGKLPVPHLLKDLLVTDELTNIFGRTLMQFLRILIGPPTSLNLRNLVWHGFPKINEIPVQYNMVILCTIITFGGLLEKGNFKSIPRRPYLLTSTHEEQMKSVLHPVSLSSYRNVLQKLRLPVSLSIILHRINQMFEENRHGHAAILILPQIEHLTRLLFAFKNNCKNRIVTAESTSLFTTFDEMLVLELPDGSANKLWDVITENEQAVLLDLLAYADGPRVRDHLSHAEMSFDDFSESLSRQLLSVLIFILLKSYHCLEMPYDEEINQLQISLSKYEANFHPLSATKYKLIEACSALKDWNELPRPNSDQVEGFPKWENTLSTGINMTFAVLLKFDARLSITCLYPFGEIDCFTNILADNRICIRKQFKDSAVLKLVRQISSTLNKVAQQVRRACEMRFGQWERKELRSRQRTTYIRQIASIPAISTSLRLCLLLCINIWYFINSGSYGTLSWLITNIRYLKSVLQFTENMLTLTHQMRNKWDETNMLSLNFMKNAAAKL